MMKARRSGKEKKHSCTRSSSSSSMSRCMLCKCGEEVILLISSTSSGKTFWRCPNWNSNQSCNFFRWCEEEDVQTAGREEGQRWFELEIANLEFKTARLKRKLSEKRVVRKLMAIVIVGSWAVTLGLCIIASVICVRS